MENLDYKIKREKFLCEAMGICWHENFPVCDKCGEVVDFHNSMPDFSTWWGFGKLWEWATQQDWFSVFMFGPDGEYNFPILNLVNPDCLADAIHEFLMEQNNRGVEIIQFVGGQEDGNYLKIRKGVEVWEVYDESEPRLTYKHSEEPGKHEVRILEYMRRGNVMRLKGYRI